MTAGTPDRDKLQFVLGPADELRAEAYVRLVDGPADAVVRGTLTGPRCRRATTLPTTMPLRPLAGGRTAAARVIVTEPSYWTPDLPNLYELDAEACAPSGQFAATRRLVGLRRLGVRGRSIWLDGRRWVPRGVAVADETVEAGAWSTDGLAAVVADPGPAACAAADVAGVPLLIAPDPTIRGRQLADRVSAWARHPAVVIVVLDVERATALMTATVDRGTLLVGCVADGVEQPPRAMPTGVDCLVMRLEPGASPAAAWRTDAPELPIVAWRRAAGGTRRDCDALQAQLAAWGGAGGTPAWDWAGYVVA